MATIGSDAPGVNPISAPQKDAQGAIEVAPRTYVATKVSNVIAFDTDGGLVLVDSGPAPAAEGLLRAIREKTRSPLDTLILTHGHTDHAYGITPWLKEAQEKGNKKPRIIAHEGFARRYERYVTTAGYNAIANLRQFGAASRFDNLPFVPPDITFHESLEIEVGKEKFAIRHGRGETDDHAWVYCPGRRVLCGGDLYGSTMPNAGNPQKVQRYPWDWAKALKDMASLVPPAEILCPGHGSPIKGKEQIQSLFLETADFLDSIVKQTLELLNRGVAYDEIVLKVKPPSELAGKEHLRPTYDHPEFIVRNVLRYFGGWWDLNPAMLMPASYKQQAAEIVNLAGGTQKLIARALKLKEAGNLRLATHLADWAARGAPDDDEARKVRSEIYAARAATEASLMARSIFNAAVKEGETKL